MLPGRNLMIVDFGSAITCDIVTAEGRYLGGSISPGLGMRFRSLADYTDRLPLLEAEACVGYEEREVPSSTVGAMVSFILGSYMLIDDSIPGYEGVSRPVIWVSAAWPIFSCASACAAAVALSLSRI